MPYSVMRARTVAACAALLSMCVLFPCSWAAGAAAEKAATEAPKPGQVLVTQSWDDVPLNDARLVPLLKKYKAKATFFIDPRNVSDERQPADGSNRNGAFPTWGWFGNGKLSIADIRELFSDSTLFEVGSHSMTHPPLDRLPVDLLKSELAESKRILELWVGRPVRGFAYPGGGGDTEAVIREIQSAGYAYARTVANDPRVYPPQNPYQLKVSRTWNAPDFWEEFERVKKEGGVFYFWGHSYEIKEDRDWVAFEDKIARLSADPDVRWVTNIEIFGK